MTIAIDFGTSNTVIARWNQVTQEPETLKLPGLSVISGQNPALIPSLFYIENATEHKFFVGQQVRDRGLDLEKSSRYFRNFKRGIGSSIQGFLPELEGKNLTFEQIGEWFLTQVIQSIYDLPLPIESLVFTVPVDSFEVYRHWLGQVCQSLKIEQVRMLDEPTAAALGYGLADQEIVLVIDFGGGTLDLSLVRLDTSVGKKPLGFILKWGENFLAESSGQKPKIARVLAKAGQNLGGSDIDYWIVDYFGENQGLPRSSLTTRLAERLKIQLSLNSQATEVYFDDQTLETFELELNREQFERILQHHQFLQKLEDSLGQVLQQARRQGVEVNDIDAVLLVGGTTKIPAVQSLVKQYFPPQKIRAEKPFEAVAQGALQLSLGIEVKDFLYHSYGIRYWNRRENCHSWHPLIKAGQPYPMTEPVELILGASVDNQPSIELIIGELGDSSSGGMEVYFDGDRLMTRQVSNTTFVQPLNDREGARQIAQLTPPGHPGTDRIKLLFEVDHQRFLRLTVNDLLTNETLLNHQILVQLS